jgi:hypothetical protein
MRMYQSTEQAGMVREERTRTGTGYRVGGPPVWTLNQKFSLRGRNDLRCKSLPGWCGYSQWLRLLSLCPPQMRVDANKGALLPRNSRSRGSPESGGQVVLMLALVTQAFLLFLPRAIVLAPQAALRGSLRMAIRLRILLYVGVSPGGTALESTVTTTSEKTRCDCTTRGKYPGWI